MASLRASRREAHGREAGGSVLCGLNQPPIPSVTMARTSAAPKLSSGGSDYGLDPDGQSMLAGQVDEATIPREIRSVINFVDEIRRVADEGAIVEDRR